MGILTKYIVIYKMNENKNVLINTLNSAIDVIDNNTRRIVFQSGASLYKNIAVCNSCS